MNMCLLQRLLSSITKPDTSNWKANFSGKDCTASDEVRCEYLRRGGIIVPLPDSPPQSLFSKISGLLHSPCILSKCHLWRKTEDGDLIVKVWVLEVRLHVGIVEASLGCQHHAISRLGCLSFQLQAFCFEGNLWNFLTKAYLEFEHAVLDVKGKQCKVHVARHCWLC